MNHEQYRLGRSLNKDWIRGRVKHIPHNYRQNSTEKARTKNVRVKSASPLRSASADMFLESREDEINDTVKEFKLTMQLFKRLTQQVRDVNQCMNQQRIYSFKHHMNNEGIASPALRRSQLAAAMSKREIPATEAPYEPCNDLGPTCASYMTRPCSRHERAASSPVPMPRPSSSGPPSRTSSPSPTLRPSSRTNTKRTTAERTTDPKKLQQDLAEADAKARVEWEESDPHFEELFVPEELELDDLGFKFHDPYPETWVEETVEDACFRGTKKTDPFMHRLKELENLKEETVLWEIYREEKAKQSADAASSSRGLSDKFSRLSSGAASHPRTQSAKVVAPQLYRGKSAVNRLRRTSSAGKGNLSNQTISASDESSDSVQTFRNSGYQLGISFVPGSLYPEARPPPKSRTRAKSPNGEKNSKKVRNASASANTPTNDNKKTLVPKSLPCEACNPRPVVSPRSTLPRSVATSVHALRSQYALKASECYDIVELARTFDPPCKAHFVKAKAKQTGSGVDNALVKGISPGKSYFSQRRISLTRMTPDESMTVRGVSPQNMTRPSTGRCKSAKKGPKKR